MIQAEFGCTVVAPPILIENATRTQKNNFDHTLPLTVIGKNGKIKNFILFYSKIFHIIRHHESKVTFIHYTFMGHVLLL